MKRLNKLLIAAAAVIAGIAISILLVSRSGGENISEEEVSAMITDRYGGEIENISQTEDEQSYIVDLGIEDIVTEKNEGQSNDTASGGGEETMGERTSEEKSAEGKDDGLQEKEKMDRPITEDEARKIASDEVGGQFIHLTLNQDTHPQQYQIIQLVEDDDEGALVTVDAIEGETMNILWFQADFNEIADIEAFARQLQDYSTKYQNNHYIEFDDDNDDDDAGDVYNEDDSDDD